jgi:hypothetical protein
LSRKKEKRRVKTVNIGTQVVAQIFVHARMHRHIYPGTNKDTYIRVPNRREIPSQASLHRKRQQFIDFNLPF